MHFAPAVAGGILGAYLAESRELTAPSDLTFDVGDPLQELFRLTGHHEAGDVLRVQSQVQLDMISGETGAACWTRVEIYENGTRKYQSICDQRFIRNSSDSADDHDAGTFGPFGVYQTQERASLASGSSPTVTRPDQRPCAREIVRSPPDGRSFAW